VEVDEVVVCTNAVLTHWPTAQQILVAFNTTALGVVIKEIVFGN
jgi:hypothetical protein